MAKVQRAAVIKEIPMPKWDEWFGPYWGERHHGPKALALTDLQRVHFHEYVIYLMKKLHYTDVDFAKVLECSPDTVRRFSNQRKGDMMRSPSFRFAKKVALFALSDPSPRPSWAPIAVHKADYHDAVPGDRIRIHATQCIECIEEFHRGDIPWEKTWWIKNPKSLFCTPTHKSKWHKRQQKIKQDEGRYSKAKEQLENLFYGTTAAAAFDQPPPRNNPEWVHPEKRSMELDGRQRKGGSQAVEGTARRRIPRAEICEDQTAEEDEQGDHQSLI